MTRDEQIHAIALAISNKEEELRFLIDSDYRHTWYGPEPTMEEVAAVILDALMRQGG